MSKSMLLHVQLILRHFNSLLRSISKQWKLEGHFSDKIHVRNEDIATAGEIRQKWSVSSELPNKHAKKYSLLVHSAYYGEDFIAMRL